jgi:hypothetical protein
MKEWKKDELASREDSLAVYSVKFGLLKQQLEARAATSCGCQDSDMLYNPQPRNSVW